MNAARCQPEQAIARPDLGSIHNGSLFHNPKGEARQIIFTLGVAIRHFGSFSANQGAACELATLGNPRDDLLSLVKCKLAAGEVIQKKERFCTLNQDIVD